MKFEVHKHNKEFIKFRMLKSAKYSTKDKLTKVVLAI